MVGWTVCATVSRGEGVICNFQLRKRLLTLRPPRAQRGGIILNFECFPAVAGHAHAWILDWWRAPGADGDFDVPRGCGTRFRLDF